MQLHRNFIDMNQELKELEKAIQWKTDPMKILKSGKRTEQINFAENK